MKKILFIVLVALCSTCIQANSSTQVKKDTIYLSEDSTEYAVLTSYKLDYVVTNQIITIYDMFQHRIAIYDVIGKPIRVIPRHLYKGEGIILHEGVFFIVVDGKKAYKIRV